MDTQKPKCINHKILDFSLHYTISTIILPRTKNLEYFFSPFTKLYDLLLGNNNDVIWMCSWIRVHENATPHEDTRQSEDGNHYLPYISGFSPYQKTPMLWQSVTNPWHWVTSFMKRKKSIVCLSNRWEIISYLGSFWAFFTSTMNLGDAWQQSSKWGVTPNTCKIFAVSKPWAADWQKRGCFHFNVYAHFDACKIFILKWYRRRLFWKWNKYKCPWNQCSNIINLWADKGKWS